jgi:putative ABC transport system permease protein
MNGVGLAAGRFLSDEDDELRNNVAVLGSAAAKSLFPLDEPLGQTVSAGGHLFVIVGVVRERPPATGGKEVEDTNGDIYLPLQTCRVRFGAKVFVRSGGARTAEEVQLSSILLTLRDPGQAAAVAEVLSSQLQRSHARKDWEVRTSGTPRD